MERDELGSEGYEWDGFTTETVEGDNGVLVWRVVTKAEQLLRSARAEQWAREKLERWNASVRRADGEG